MTALGGTFDLQSEPGKGTVASLHLPFTTPDESIETQLAEVESPVILNDASYRRVPSTGSMPPPAGEANGVTPLRVLIVDDHQMVREGLICILKQYHDLTVVGEASTGEQALEMAGTLMPDVIIMDMQMPGWNGAESTSRILKEHPAIVVIGLSIQTDPHVSNSMLAAGAAGFLPKETVGNELYSTIQAAVRRTKPPRQITSHLAV
jgi:CheY-like chemotaxis protein